MQGALLVPAGEAPRDGAQRGAAHVGRGRQAGQRDAADDALADALSGDEHLAGAGRGRYALQDGRAGADRVGAVRVQARQQAALVEGPPGERGQQRVQAAGADRVAMQAMDGVGTAVAVHLGEVAHAAARPHQDVAVRQRGHAGPAQGIAHMRREPSQVRRGRRVVGQVLVPHAQHAEGERPGRLDRAVPEVHDLHAAAADIDQQAVVDGQAVDRAHERLLRLGLRVDHVDRESQAAAGGRQDGVRVAGVAQGGRRDGADALRAGPAGDGHELVQRGERGGDGVVGQAAVGPEREREPQRRAQLLHDLQMATRLHLDDDDAGGVGAEVDGGDAFGAGEQRGGGGGGHPGRVSHVRAAGRLSGRFRRHIFGRHVRRRPAATRA